MRNNRAFLGLEDPIGAQKYESKSMNLDSIKKIAMQGAIAIGAYIFYKKFLAGKFGLPTL
jgi:hypothetical protein